MKKLISFLLVLAMLIPFGGVLAQDIVTPTTAVTFPLEEPVTFRIMVNRTTDDSSDLFNSRPQNAYIEELTNIHIE